MKIKQYAGRPSDLLLKKMVESGMDQVFQLQPNQVCLGIFLN